MTSERWRLSAPGGFAVGAAFGAAAGDVGAGARVHPRLGERHHVDRLVHPPVAGPVEPVPLSLSGGGRDGRGAVQGGEVPVGGDAVDVADLADDPGRDQLADADELDEAGAELAHAAADLPLDLAALGVDLADPLDPPAGEARLDGVVAARAAARPRRASAARRARAACCS